MKGTPTKNTFVFILLLLTGIVLGGLIGEIAAKVSWLSFLNYGKTFGVSAGSPLVLDLWVVRMVFGIEFHMSVAVILGLFSSIVAYKKLL